MKVQFNWLLMVILCSASTAACTKKQKSEDPTKVVRVLSYSSMGSEGGFLRSVQQEFLAQTQCQLKVETTQGAAQILTVLKENAGAFDWVVGIDELLFERGAEYWENDPAFIKWFGQAPQQFKWKKSVTETSTAGFLPLDYGALTFIYQKEALKKLKLNPPVSVEDLLKPEYKKKFIVQDPRVSSPGLQFFSWLPATVPLSKLKSQWLSLAQGWEASYQMFLHGEAPMVWSYLSSIAYHESKGQGKDYGYVDFKEGLPLHREGMAKVKKGSGFLGCNQKWAEFVYSPATQAKLVEKQFMLPVVENSVLPAAFGSIAHFNHFSARTSKLKETDQLLSTFAKEIQGDAW